MTDVLGKCESMWGVIQGRQLDYFNYFPCLPFFFFCHVSYTLFCNFIFFFPF